MAGPVSIPSADDALHNDVLPFYRNLDLPVKSVLTDNGREFCGTERHPYELYLDLNGIEHRRTRVKSPKTNGFVEGDVRLTRPTHWVRVI
jgi:transposase InsO family protein